ncbi:hypothetical protein AS038_16150 [Arthrobacter sp. NIO-1057]|nr:hypothetical protein AS038_16150 [Arthrobacter sp. NIO-1057]
MLCIHQIKIIRYQQTWHTIEFSNNKHLPVLYPPFQAVISSSVIFKSYHREFLKVKSIVCDLNQYSWFPFFNDSSTVTCVKPLIFWGFASDLHPVICSVLLSATRKNYTQVLGVVQIGDLVFPGDRAHLMTDALLDPRFLAV